MCKVRANLGKFSYCKIKDMGRGLLNQSCVALDTNFVTLACTEPAPVPPIPNEQQLARLTDYVAFLEN